MRATILLPFLAAAQCLEMAVIFFAVYLKVSRRPENLVFSLLAFFLGGMIGCELLLQETDSLVHGLFWYRLQFLFALFSSALMIHFLSLIAGRPLTRQVGLGLLYPLTALMAAGAWHPLVLHLPPPSTLLSDIDTGATGSLFYTYVALPLTGPLLASFLGLHGLKYDRKQTEEVADFQPLFRHASWIVVGVLIVVMAAILEILQLLLPPAYKYDFPINPRAIAISFFCIVTVWSLGREHLLTEKREQQFAAENKLLDALVQFRLQTVRDIHHEIGNNLAGISAPLKLALRGLEQGRPPIHLAERLTDALVETQEMEALIQIMLNTSRMEAGQAPQLEPTEPTDVLALVQSLCTEKAVALAQVREVKLLGGILDAALPKYSLHMSASLLHAQAPAHADTLTRILNNLLDNAVKYTPNGGDIHIHIHEQASELEITLSDPGLGIPPEDQARIFDEPFYRGRAAAHLITGTGLGLNLVKRLLQAQGGRISVVSAPGQGSAFTVTLPWTPDESVL